MIHQVEAHHTGAVGDAVRVAFTGGNQQNFWAFDTVGGEHEALAGDAMADLVAVEIMHRHDLSLVIGLDAVHDRIGDNTRPGRQGFIRRNAAVILRVDRADRHAVVIAAAGRAAVIGHAVTRLRADTYLVTQPGDALLKAFKTVRQRDAGQRVGAGARRVQFAVAGHPHLVLRLAIIRLQLFITDWPVAADAVQGFHPHVVWQQAKSLPGPVPGGAADAAQILGAVRIRAFLDQIVVVRRNKFRLRCPGFGREGFGEIAFERRVAKQLDRLIAFDFRAGLQHQHRSAGLHHFQCRQRTGDTGANYHNIGI
ncbi:hypothetical protein D3C81_992830 [compost metagenome]